MRYNMFCTASQTGITSPNAVALDGPRITVALGPKVTFRNLQE